MNTNFHIEEYNNPNPTYIVLTMSYVSFSDYLPEIAKVLNLKTFKGTVLFDLLLNNGRHHRFYDVEFSDKTFQLSTFKNIKPNQDLLKFCANFYIKNLSLIDDSLFPESENTLIKNHIKEYSQTI